MRLPCDLGACSYYDDIEYATHHGLMMGGYVGEGFAK